MSEDNQQPEKCDYTRANYLLARKQWNIGYPLTVGSLIFAGIAAVAVSYQGCKMKVGLDESRAEFKAAQQPYVVLGSQDGTLAELHEIKGKQFIALHFVNTGNSTARDLAIRARVTVPKVNIYGDFWQHRHRWVDPSGAMTTDEMAIPIDLGAKAEHTEYLSVGDATRQQLTDTWLENVDWTGTTVYGQMEYCDIFGTYHCEKFDVAYKPSLEQFVGTVGPDGDTCVIPDDQDLKQMALEQRLGKREIEPCRQPNEPDHQTDAEREATEHFRAVFADPSPTSSPKIR